MPARPKFFLDQFSDFGSNRNLGGPVRRKICNSAIHFALFFFASAIFLFLARSVFALTNGDFESADLSSWKTYGGANVFLVTDPVRTGIQAVKVQNTSLSSYGIQQVVTGISEGKTYRFSGYEKITDSNVAKAFLRIAWYESSDGSGSQKSTDDSNQITEITDWSGLAIEKTAPSGVASAKVRAILASKTSDTEAFVYFDDLTFEEIELIPTPSPTPIPTPATGTYKINEVKNEDGDTVSNVKVYVDGEYTHHYAPEDLTFGDNKYCDNNKEVECSFGQHTIKLEKSGYEDWSETKTINSGDYYEDNPVMERTSSDSSSPTSTPTPIVSGLPTPTRKPTPTKKLSPTPTPTPGGEILGEEATPEAEALSFDDSQESTPSSFSLQNFLPFIFIGFGSLFLAIAGGSVLLPNLKKKYRIRKHGKAQETI